MADTQPLIAIVGATGTGKSSLALELAEAFVAEGRPAEIVNADAMQIYRGMNIGTAKLPVEDRRGIAHHLLDVLDVTDEASVAGYQAAARAAIEQIRARDAAAILVGGSGLYVSSVIYDFQFPGTDAVVRGRLETELLEVGPGILYQRLRVMDPDAATAIGPHNGRRIVRALEVIELTGRPFGSGLPGGTECWRPTVTIGLRAPRTELVLRLDERVRGMWRSGLVDEVRALLPQGLERGVTASRAIGYAQALAQLRGELRQEQAIIRTQQLTRRYARRQVSWFTRYASVAWFDYDTPDVAARVFAATR